MVRYKLLDSRVTIHDVLIPQRQPNYQYDLATVDEVKEFGDQAFEAAQRSGFVNIGGLLAFASASVGESFSANSATVARAVVFSSTEPSAETKIWLNQLLFPIADGLNLVASTSTKSLDPAQRTWTLDPTTNSRSLFIMYGREEAVDIGMWLFTKLAKAVESYASNNLDPGKVVSHTQLLGMASSKALKFVQGLYHNLRIPLARQRLENNVVNTTFKAHYESITTFVKLNSTRFGWIRNLHVWERANYFIHFQQEDFCNGATAANGTDRRAFFANPELRLADSTPASVASRTGYVTRLLAEVILPPAIVKLVNDLTVSSDCAWDNGPTCCGTDNVSNPSSPCPQLLRTIRHAMQANLTKPASLNNNYINRSAPSPSPIPSAPLSPAAILNIICRKFLVALADPTTNYSTSAADAEAFENAEWLRTERNQGNLPPECLDPGDVRYIIGNIHSFAGAQTLVAGLILKFLVLTTLAVNKIDIRGVWEGERNEDEPFEPEGMFIHSMFLLNFPDQIHAFIAYIPQIDPSSTIKLCRTASVLAGLQEMVPELAANGLWIDAHVHARHAGSATDINNLHQEESFVDTIRAMATLSNAPVWIMLQSYNRTKLMEKFGLPIGILTEIKPDQIQPIYIYAGDEEKMKAGGGYRRLTPTEQALFSAKHWKVVDLGLETTALFCYNFLGGVSRLFLFGPHPCAVNPHRYSGIFSNNAIDSLRRLFLDLALLFEPIQDPSTIPEPTAPPAPSTSTRKKQRLPALPGSNYAAVKLRNAQLSAQDDPPSINKRASEATTTPPNAKRAKHNTIPIILPGSAMELHQISSGSNSSRSTSLASTSSPTVASSIDLTNSTTTSTTTTTSNSIFSSMPLSDSFDSPSTPADDLDDSDDSVSFGGVDGDDDDFDVDDDIGIVNDSDDFDDFDDADTIHKQPRYDYDKRLKQLFPSDSLPEPTRPSLSHDVDGFDDVDDFNDADDADDADDAQTISKPRRYAYGIRVARLFKDLPPIIPPSDSLPELPPPPDLTCVRPPLRTILSHWLYQRHHKSTKLHLEFSIQFNSKFFINGGTNPVVMIRTIRAMELASGVAFGWKDYSPALIKEILLVIGGDITQRVSKCTNLPWSFAGRYLSIKGSRSIGKYAKLEEEERNQKISAEDAVDLHRIRISAFWTENLQSLGLTEDQLTRPDRFTIAKPLASTIRSRYMRIAFESPLPRMKLSFTNSTAKATHAYSNHNKSDHRQIGCFVTSRGLGGSVRIPTHGEMKGEMVDLNYGSICSTCRDDVTMLEEEKKMCCVKYEDAIPFLEKRFGPAFTIQLLRDWGKVIIDIESRSNQKEMSSSRKKLRENNRKVEEKIRGVDEAYYAQIALRNQEDEQQEQKNFDQILLRKYGLGIAYNDIAQGIEDHKHDYTVDVIEL